MISRQGHEFCPHEFGLVRFQITFYAFGDAYLAKIILIPTDKHSVRVVGNHSKSKVPFETKSV